MDIADAGDVLHTYFQQNREALWPDALAKHDLL
jgi:hypothetical protein